MATTWDKVAEQYKDQPAKLWLITTLAMLRTMGFIPSPEQIDVLRCRSRLLAISGGEQSGKSYTAGMIALAEMPYCKLIWLVGDDYEQTHPEFEYMLTGLNTYGVVDQKHLVMPMRGSWSAKFLGKRLVTRSAQDVRKLAKEAPDLIIMCEAAQMGYDAYLKCRGRIAPRRGRLVLVGTLEASNDWYAWLVKRWQVKNPEEGRSFIIPSWANLALYPKGRQDPEILRLEKELPPEIFAMRFGAKAVPAPNLIFRAFDFEKHVPGDVVFDKELPVQLWIDPGYSGSFYAVEVVQIAEADQHFDGTHVHVIDELYMKYATTPEVIEVAQKKEWWGLVEGGTIDVAGTQHHANSSHVEMWSAENVALMAEHIKVEEGIQRHHTFLKDPATQKPRIFFNENCVGAFGEYGRWKKRLVQEGVNQTGKPELVNCDAMKAIQYGLILNFGYVDYEGEEASIENPFSF